MKNIYKLMMMAATGLGGFCPKADAQLIINELMQSNIDCIMDDLNEFPDSWVELFNAGNETVNLKNYKIGDSEKLKKAWQLPNLEVKPGEYVIVYCDKVGKGLHASFRLESGKDGAVYLFKDDEIADKQEGMKKQPAPNIAWGRETDGSDTWGYQNEPTPGASNCGRICSKILGEPVFNRPGSLITSGFQLELSLPEDAPEGTEIRYTLNGMEPTAASTKYSASISVDKSRIVRAKLFCDGYLSPRSTTHSYINHGRELNLPVVSIVTDDKYFYSSKMGIYVDGSYTPGTPNYQYDWRRPINFEYFEGVGKESAINQLCETRVKGGATRGSALKSLALYANKRFGTKRFEYEFFPDQTPGIDEFKSFEMRNSGNDFDYMYMRDGVIQQSMGMNCDLDWQPSRPTVVYINGVYKGILNIRPRSNEDYIYSYYHGLEDVDMLENWWELKEGDLDNFNAFQNFYNEKGHSYQEFEEWMDTGEFCNLFIMNIFFDNEDFPGNNIVMWRPQAEGGRWRWIAKDTDFGMGLYGQRPEYPTLNWITTQGYDNNRNEWANKAEHSRLFRRLLDTPEFKDMFIDRAALYMGDFLTPDQIIARIDTRYDAIKDEYLYHRSLFNPWWPVYKDEVNWGRSWTKSRWTFFYKHLAEFFGLNQPVELAICKDGDNSRRLIVNGVSLTGGSFDGKFFPGRRLTVEASEADDGLYVNGWEVSVAEGAEKRVQKYEGDKLDIEMPQGSRVEIAAVLGTEPAAVEGITADLDDSKPCEIYDLSGRSLGTAVAPGHLPSLTPGVYILRQGAASRKITVNRHF